MKSIEISAKTKDEAIIAAMIELGCTEDQIDVEVLNDNKGFLGLFGKSVKIRASVKEVKKEAPKAKKQDNAEAKPAKETKLPKENKSQMEAKPVKENKPKEIAPKAQAKQETKTYEVEGLTVTGEKVVINDTIEQRLRKANANRQNQEEGRENRRPSRDRRNARPRNEKVNEVSEAAEEKEAVKETRTFEPKVYEIPADSEKVIADVKDFLGKLMKEMGIEATIEAAFTEDGILGVDLEGEGMGLIIGKRGATLDSLQYLATLVINKDRNDHIRLKLDTEGYRARRQETLEKLALNMAKKAKRIGHRVVLEPMNPYERRIIHSALQSDHGVETHSDGEEPYRKVIITPKRRH